MEKRKKRKERKSSSVILIIQIIFSVLISAGVIYSHGREGMPYSRINAAAEYVLFHSADIGDKVDRIRIYAEKLEEHINQYIPQRENGGGDYDN